MQENELFVLFLSTVVLLFIVFYRKELKRLPAAGWLFSAYVAIWIGWCATTLEHLMAPTFFNMVEHIAYAANGLLLLLWCWFGIKNGRVGAHD
ncbi:hypothetical protein DWB84_02390 [Saccharophagus sp. K07]|uniref:hypothetical protein n=1 Tax=Saccharophagus sp. K07 TaxID=2283636 RepID=UPI0016529B95|nr:hypothetical protein [Saccharophagus sp. K07]MBC6904318.1 hypothetical protein [Saccharophagus sp. K07]